MNSIPIVLWELNLHFLRQKPMIYFKCFTQILYICENFIFRNGYFSKRLTTYQSGQHSMDPLFICHQLCLSEYCWKVCVTFHWIFFVIVSLCQEWLNDSQPENKNHVKFMGRFVTSRRDSLSMSGRYYHTYWQLQRRVGVQVCTCYVSITVLWSLVANTLETTIHLP